MKKLFLAILPILALGMAACGTEDEPATNNDNTPSLTPGGGADSDPTDPTDPDDPDDPLSPTNLAITVSSSGENAAFFLADPEVKVFAHYFNNVGDNGWVNTTFTSASASFEIPSTSTGFLLVRCPASTTTPNWLAYGDRAGRIYNQSDNVALVAEQTEYQFTVGGGEGDGSYNGPQRILVATKGTDTVQYGAYYDSNGDQYTAANVYLQEGAVLSAINNETEVPYDISPEGGVPTTVYNEGVVTTGNYNVYIKPNGQYWIAAVTPSV